MKSCNNSCIRRLKSFYCLSITCCILLTGLTSVATPLRAQGKKKAAATTPTVASIKLERADQSTLTPGEQITIIATPLDKKGLPIPGAININWKFANETDGEYAALGQPVNTKASHLNTLTGRTPPKGNQTIPAAIVVRAMVGDMFNDISVPYKAALESENSNITFDLKIDNPNKHEIAPGLTGTLTASVKDANGNVIPDAKVKWSIAAEDQKGFLLLSMLDNDQTPNTVTVVGLAKSSAKPPDHIAVAASYGGTARIFMVPYKANPSGESDSDSTATNPTDFEVVDSREEKDLEVEPGKRITLKARSKEKDKNGKHSEVLIHWVVPDEMKPYISKVSPEGDELTSEAEFFGLLPREERSGNNAEPAPETISILATAGKFRKVANIRYGQPEVDVSWNVLPSSVVTSNYGSKVSEEFYCIEVAIGNNSGSDLQLSGLSFDLSAKDSSNNSLPIYYDKNDPDKLYSGIRVPAASFDVVRGITEQSNLSFGKGKGFHIGRGMLINSLDAFSQFLTGFNPFFHVATHARNFSQGVNILSNPITKGLERVWPDPYQDEMNRLEQQTLHDDKIIPNHTIYKTRVFFPKSALFSMKKDNNGKDIDGDTQYANDLVVVRKRLGQLVLVGDKLTRNDFQFRVRQSSGTGIR